MKNYSPILRAFLLATSAVSIVTAQAAPLRQQHLLDGETGNVILPGRDLWTVKSNYRLFPKKNVERVDGDDYTSQDTKGMEQPDISQDDSQMAEKEMIPSGPLFPGWTVEMDDAAVDHAEERNRDETTNRDEEDGEEISSTNEIETTGDEEITEIEVVNITSDDAIAKDEDLADWFNYTRSDCLEVELEPVVTNSRRQFLRHRNLESKGHKSSKAGDGGHDIESKSGKKSKSSKSNKSGKSSVKCTDPPKEMSMDTRMPSMKPSEETSIIPASKAPTANPAVSSLLPVTTPPTTIVPAPTAGTPPPTLSGSSIATTLPPVVGTPPPTLPGLTLPPAAGTPPPSFAGSTIATTLPPAAGTPPPSFSGSTIATTLPPAAGTPPPSFSSSTIATTLPPAAGTPPPILATLPPAAGTPTLPPAAGTSPPILATLPPVTGTPPPILPTLPPAAGTPPPILATLPPVTGTPPPILPTLPPVAGTPPPTALSTTLLPAPSGSTQSPALAIPTYSPTVGSSLPAGVTTTRLPALGTLPPTTLSPAIAIPTYSPTVGSSLTPREGDTIVPTFTFTDANETISLSPALGTAPPAPTVLTTLPPVAGTPPPTALSTTLLPAPSGSTQSPAFSIPTYSPTVGSSLSPRKGVTIVPTFTFTDANETILASSGPVDAFLKCGVLAPNPYSFEGVSFPQIPWGTSENSGWSISIEKASNGTSSLRSPLLVGSPTSTTSNATLKVCSDFLGGVLRTQVYASVEPPRDIFIIYIDGEEAAQLESVSEWQTLELGLTAGQHRIDFSYQYTGTNVTNPTTEGERA